LLRIQKTQITNPFQIERINNVFKFKKPTEYNLNINGGDVQRKNVVNNVDKSSLWAP